MSRTTDSSGTDVEQQDKPESILGKGLKALILVGFVASYMPKHMPFSFFHFWKSTGSIGDWIIAALPVCLIGVVSSVAFYGSLKKHGIQESDSPAIMSTAGIFISAISAIMSEISIRWLVFYASILGATFTNWILTKIFGFALIEWLDLNIAAHVANFFTFGLMHEWLFHPENWAIGAGVLIANAFFRDWHQPENLLGATTSWYTGMFLFWMMFTYGLPAAIVAHFIYLATVLSVILPLHNWFRQA